MADKWKIIAIISIILLILSIFINLCIINDSICAKKEEKSFYNSFKGSAYICAKKCETIPECERVKKMIEIRNNNNSS